MRPTTRPDKPYTIDEIKERVRQHFIVENNPKCIIGGLCSYAGTGCAVGCLLTEEDGNALQNWKGHFDSVVGNIGPVHAAIHEMPEVLRPYFDIDNDSVVEFLCDLQRAHDRSSEGAVGGRTVSECLVPLVGAA